ncbi:hypothetical protein CASFOL_003987 [Castilleja foliolosa]|uniref:Uncharacterized protein n=1 Tax=Castilleja foliolosa TaxID=1961234 RepID=A0ABD3EJ53_9LAMI
MAANVPPRPCDVADAFVKQYYAILSKYPENAHKFYAETSLLGWPGSDGVITPVTTLSAISDKILSSNYKNCIAEVSTVDAQASHDGGVIVSVTGSFLEKDEVATIFVQSFFLARQEKGFFILNDILRVLDAPTLQKPDVSVSENTDAKVVLSASLDALDEKPASNGNVAPVVLALSGNVPLVAEPISNANVSPVVAPAANVNVSSAVASVEKETAPLSVAPAANKTVPSAAAVASNVAVKITYATMVAKTTPVGAPVTPPKAPVPLANGAPKASTPPLANGAPKPLALTTKVTTKSTTGGNSAPNTNARPEVRAIYVGNLPIDVTKQKVAEVMKQFGPVRRHPDSVQLRKHSDGFCCAFVEFETPDSARVAVEAHNVKFGEKLAYIAHKKSTYNRDQGLLQGVGFETATKTSRTGLGLINGARGLLQGLGIETTMETSRAEL